MSSVIISNANYTSTTRRDAEALRDSDGDAATTSQREPAHTFVRDDQLNMDRVPSAWGVLVPQCLTEVLVFVLVVLIALIVSGGARFVSLRSLFAAAILAAFCAIRVAWRSSTVFEERMIVIKDIGIQRITRYYGGRESYRFVESNKIQAIVINEGFFNMNVIPYLAFILHDAGDMVLAFEHLFPRMDPLIRIFRGTRALVLGEAEDEQSDDSSSAVLEREQSNEEKPPAVPSVPRTAETLARSAHQRHASHGASLYPSSSKKRKRIHKRLPSTPL